MRLLKVALTLCGVSAGVFAPSEAQAFGRRSAVCVPAQQVCSTSQPVYGQPCVPSYCSTTGSVMRSFGAGVPVMTSVVMGSVVTSGPPIVGGPGPGVTYVERIVVAQDPSIKDELVKILTELGVTNKRIGEPKDKEEALVELLKAIKDKIK